MAEFQAPRTRYRSIVADSGRWDGFAFRPGDVVISTPPKSGTTWTQVLCALLIFNGPEFPAPLEAISPWLDMNIRPLAEVTAALAAQTHRRFIKTHTPLDGLPLQADVTYLVVGRDPRDVAVSYEHHIANMDFARFLELRAAAVGNEDLAELPERRVPSADPVERFRVFVAGETRAMPPTLASVLHHLDTGWQRRHEPNVSLFHYADLQADLAGELLRLACVLGIPCSPERARACDRSESGADARAQRRRCAERVAGDLEGRASLFPQRRNRRMARAPFRRRPRRVRGASRGAGGPGPRRLGAWRLARFGRRSGTLTRPRRVRRRRTALARECRLPDDMRLRASGW
jgi:hypothetical protein